MKLYELTEQWDAVFNMMEDGETDEQVVFDTLEAIEGEIEDKADNYAKIIRNLQASVDALKAEEDRLYQRRKSAENHIQRLKDTLQANLEFIGKTKFKTDLFSFSVSKNGGKQPIFITDNLDEIPGKYLIPQPPRVNNEAVRELLKDKEVDWARFEPYGRHLNIRQLLMEEVKGISPYRMGQIAKTAGIIAEQLTHGKYLYNPTYQECEIVLDLIMESIKKCKDK